MSSNLFKNIIYKLFFYKSYLIYMYKKDLALNSLQRMICHKTQPTDQDLILLWCI